MMALTHGAIALGTVSLLLGSPDMKVMGLSIIGSQLPDIDMSTSALGGWFWPVSRWIEQRYPHRTMTHSFFAVLGVAIASLPLWFLLDRVTWMALWMGMLISIFSDTFTVKGVQLFWPAPVWCYCGSSNPNKRLKTGGPSEYWVITLFAALLVFSLQVNFSGQSLVSFTGSQLGIGKEVAKQYNAIAANHHVWSDINGYKASDRTPVTGRFLVVGEESGFVVMDESGVYKVGQGLVVDANIKTQKGDRAQTTLEQISFDDEEATPKLQALKQKHQGDLIFLNGAIAVDFPEDISFKTKSDQLQQLTVTGEQVKLQYCNVDDAIAALKEQWAVGTLQVKLISPDPFHGN